MAKHPAAVALGSMTSEKKAAAARENGKLGGRPDYVHMHTGGWDLDPNYRPLCLVSGRRVRHMTSVIADVTCPKCKAVFA